MPPKKGKLSSFVLDGVKYKIGDTVLVNPDEPSAPPFIGKIKQIYQKSSVDEDEVELTVAWFYRPEEAIGGRKDYHGEKELFTSDHHDQIHKNTVLGKCSVHSLQDYEQLPTIADHDYFARFNYKPATKEFEPDRVPVYCTCELPYNPDRAMVMCDHCEEWFHLDCIGATSVERNYCCGSCLQATKRLCVERL